MTVVLSGQPAPGWSAPAAFPHAERLVALLATMVGLFGAAVYWWARSSLWEDEIIAVTHGLQSLPLFFIEVLRFDIHPPLYFLFIKAWRSAGLSSDHALLASSWVASLASAGVVAAVAGRLAGARAAMWALALTCVLPNFAWAAGNLRMYGMVPGLMVSLWFLWRSYLLEGGARVMCAGVLIALILAYTHAIEFYFIVFVFLGLWLELGGTSPRTRIVRAMAAQIGLGVCMLPLVASALLRGTEPLGASSLTGLMLAPAQLFTGWALAEAPWALVGGGLVCAGLLALALPDRNARWLVLGISGTALLTAIGIGFFGKPMFKSPVFTANLVPFIVLGAAVGVARNRGAWASGLVILLGAGLAGATLPWSARLTPPENFGPAGAYLAAEVHEGDVVVVPRNSVYWGVMRYAASPQWGAPLGISPPSNPQWTRLKRMLGPGLWQTLGLNAEGNFFDWQGVRYIYGSEIQVPKMGRIWIVHRARYLEHIRFNQPVREQSVRWFGDELSVSLVSVQASGVLELGPPAPQPPTPH